MMNAKTIVLKSESGLLSLEASIALPVFIFIMLFMYSFFVIFEARNEIGHVLLSTADSMALDAFATETMVGEDINLQSLLYGVFGSTSASNGIFSTTEKWYDNSNNEKNISNSDGGDTALDENSQIESVIKQRYIAYMAGGDSDKADEILKKLHVVDGLAGLDFSKSRVSGSDLYLVVSYKIEYEFDILSPNGIVMEQSCCSKLWK